MFGVDTAGNKQIVLPKDSLFPKFARDYFEQLREQYELLLEQENLSPPASVKIVLSAVEADPQKTTWAEVFLLETACLYALPDEGLAPKLALYRSRYREVAGRDAYADYLQSVPKNLTDMSPALLRAELLALGERIRYLYTFVPPKEIVRNKLAVNAAWLMVALALFAMGVAVALRWNVPTILIVMFSGLLGGFLSVQQRLQTPDNIDPLFKELQLKAGWFSVVFIAPLSGAVFASVLYWLFLAGLLSGGLFPHFGSWSSSHGVVHSFRDFLRESAPTTVSDYGKLLAWTFIAGFAERFVPDVLTRLTTRVVVGNEKEKTQLERVTSTL